jgi:hypothetical protein
VSDSIDQEAVVSSLTPEWVDVLPVAERPEAKRLLAELVADWAREANKTADPAAVLVFQRQDLESGAGHTGPAGRLPALKQTLLRRKVDHLGARTFALGVAILDGALEGGEARARGRELLTEAEALGAQMRELPQTPEAMPIRRELGDAMMEALFAIEGKAMSARLDRERQDRARR